ncbi:hypothetical protein CDD81_2376 [Ophiocordyceps australis]|uniref:Catalase n=1 Tax=Ophiocordyceps australis TaxID=1399860 RepID=A0A2C5XTZ5_9HYPO|nr:hypothetical protein CDD81_2376 [Ophiocordyceps australis]
MSWDKMMSCTLTDAKKAQVAECTLQPVKETCMTVFTGAKQTSAEEGLRINRPDQTGALLLEDGLNRQELQRFNHGPPERMLDARGAGAHGTFSLLESAADVTQASILTDTHVKTPVFVRFSTTLGSRCSADTVRDVRGFAVKMYTQQGSWDLVGSNMPVLFMHDALELPNLMPIAKAMPTAQTARNAFYDFASLHPEAAHMLLWTMSDRAIPRSYRMMQGFGVNTFILVNRAGERHFAKFHWTPMLGVHSLVWDEAVKIAGEDPDFYRRDLAEAIAAGLFPRWRLGMQTIAEARKHDFDFDVLDATKLWPEEVVPLRYIGQLELTRNADDSVAEMEHMGFCSSNLVPGIELSDDALLQDRGVGYVKAQTGRLGINGHEMPNNRRRCPVGNLCRNDARQGSVTRARVNNYWPSRLTVAEAGQRAKRAKLSNHFAQARLFWHSLAPWEQTHVKAALVYELDHCDESVVHQGIIGLLAKIDLGLGQSVAAMMGAPKPRGDGEKPWDDGEKPRDDGKEARDDDEEEQKPWPRLKGVSQAELMPPVPTVASRRIALIVADGYDATWLDDVKFTISSVGATPIVISPHRSSIFAAPSHNTGAGSVTRESPPRSTLPDHHLDAQRSTMFDAVYIAESKTSTAALAANGRLLHWIREAFGHLKPLAATGEAILLVQRALALPQVEVSRNGSPVESYGVVTLRDVTPDSFTGGVCLAAGAKAFMSRFLWATSQHRCHAREVDGLTARVAF